MRKVGVRVLERRKVGGCKGGGREAGGRTKVGVRGLEGWKLGGRRREGM